jgi:ribosomal protein S25
MKKSKKSKKAKKASSSEPRIDELVFKQVVRSLGNSLVVTIPYQLANYFKLKHGDNILVELGSDVDGILVTKSAAVVASEDE